VPIVAVTSDAGIDAADRTGLKDVPVRLHEVPSALATQILRTSPDNKAAEVLFVSSTSPFSEGEGTTLIDHLNSVLAHAPLPADLQMHLAGQLATNAAAQQQSAKQGKEIQDASILFIIVLLLVIFRSVLAPLVTLLPPRSSSSCRGRSSVPWAAPVSSRCRSSPRSC
jgi:RND superfamily putative drug exporter